MEIKRNLKVEAFYTSEEHSDFICDVENNWVQYATPEERMTAFFGNIRNAKILFEKWKKDEDIFSKQRKKAAERFSKMGLNT